MGIRFLGLEILDDTLTMIAHKMRKSPALRTLSEETLAGKA